LRKWRIPLHFRTKLQNRYAEESYMQFDDGAKKIKTSRKGRYNFSCKLIGFTAAPQKIILLRVKY